MKSYDKILKNEFLILLKMLSLNITMTCSLTFKGIAFKVKKTHLEF